MLSQLGVSNSRTDFYILCCITASSRPLNTQTGAPRLFLNGQRNAGKTHTNVLGWQVQDLMNIDGVGYSVTLHAKLGQLHTGLTGTYNRHASLSRPGRVLHQNTLLIRLPPQKLNAAQSRFSGPDGEQTHSSWSYSNHQQSVESSNAGDDGLKKARFTHVANNSTIQTKPNEHRQR